MSQALGVPGDFIRHRVEESACLIEVADRKRGRDAFEQGREPVAAVAGEAAEFLLQRGRLDEEQVGLRIQIIGQAGFLRIETDARGGGDRNGFHRCAGTLRDGIEFAD